MQFTQHIGMLIAAVLPIWPGGNHMPISYPASPPETERDSIDGTVLVPAMSGLAGGGTGAGAADAELAAGPESLVLVTNQGVHLRDKAGNLIDKMALDGEFFTRASPHKGALPHIGDPDVIYDQRAERFWIVAIEVDFADFYNRG